MVVGVTRMLRHHQRRVSVVAALVGMATALAGCSDRAESVTGNGSGADAPPRHEAFTRDGYQDQLLDLDPRELIGLTANQYNKRIFTAKYFETPVGDGHVNSFGGVRFGNELYNFVTPVLPDRAAEFGDFHGDFRIIAACTEYVEEEEAYRIYVGVLPPELATDELVQKGRRGEFDPIMERNTNCRPWGPVVPLSRVS